GLDDESRGLNDEDHSVESNGLGLREEEEVVPESQQRAVLVVGTTVSAPLGLRYRELRRRELAIVEDHVYSTFEVGQGSGSAQEPERPERVSASRQPTLTTWTDPEDGIVYIDVHAYPLLALPAPTPPLPEWSSSSLPTSPAPSIVPSPISSPMIPLTVPSPTASPATTKTKGFLTELEAQVKIYRFRSIEHEQERVAVTFRVIWRLILALESWAGQTDAQRAPLWHAISDMEGENQELRL
ncbi:hypothetical protein Tco_0816608, partial [Tanacetum coccineum]